ncbi:hypothetical protein HK099_006274 [Clydaea vesicula]|uniref:Tetrapyrrole methylase domain-containing protein n=1 Tax=Clydaea vesicula TaxID=447962 RepID=A0AAD5U625_9FUNG|nr:hypothetical protein HK099_006274 [Clydaea vesicula]
MTFVPINFNFNNVHCLISTSNLNDNKILTKIKVLLNSNAKLSIFLIKKNKSDEDIHNISQEISNIINGNSNSVSIQKVSEFDLFSTFTTLHQTSNFQGKVKFIFDYTGLDLVKSLAQLEDVFLYSYLSKSSDENDFSFINDEEKKQHHLENGIGKKSAEGKLPPTPPRSLRFVQSKTPAPSQSKSSGALSGAFSYLTGYAISKEEPTSHANSFALTRSNSKYEGITESAQIGIAQGLNLLPNVLESNIRNVLKYVPVIKIPGREGGLYLVGAGTGDPDLLTLRALNALKNSDILVYDNLISESSLKFISTNFPKLQIHQSFDVDFIASFLEKGWIVTRFYNGDPYFFSKGFEERSIFESKNFKIIDVVCGVISPFAGSVLYNIPLGRNEILTMKGNAKQVVEYNPLRTIIVMMPTTFFKKIIKLFLDSNYPPNLPCALIEKISWGQHKENATYGDLSDIVDNAIKAKVEGPACFYLGKQVGMKKKQMTLKIINKLINHKGKCEGFRNYYLEKYKKLDELENASDISYTSTVFE